ncbi:MAG TPA: peptidoglycan DD-metalloendopeptidase family protein [Propionibacteriaceae bacterium]|nr:peptidoglycan DD-metalloendopeptidase family protein [Propionibacteriaceae bacterium]
MILRRRVALVLLCGLLGALALLIAAPPAVAEPPLPGPAGWPLAGPPAVVRAFDGPDHEYGPGHRGVDLAADPGQPVRAAVSGVVAFAGKVAGRGVVSIDHGAFRTTYEPVVAGVRTGQRVALGGTIGRVGTGGHCADRCLHWGLRHGERYLDPLQLFTTRASGPLRLLAADRRAVARERAAARAEAAAAFEAGLDGGMATAFGAVGPGGRHGFGRPTPGAITSAYGMRFHPVLRRWKLHDGTDFGAACGTPIRAPYAGTVSSTAYGGAYGHRLLLAHGSVDGYAVTTSYNHARGYVVGPGDRVAKGQLLGHVGSTGLSTGCHLHLMVWLNGRLVDPMSWF